MARLNRITPGLEALSELAGEVAILHRGLTSALHPLGLVRIGTEDKVVMDGVGRAFDRPEGWLPTHITLAYGAEGRTPAADFYFVRIWLRRAAVWIGLSVDAQRLRSASQGLVDDIASHAESTSLEVAGVDWLPTRPNVMTVRVETLPASPEAIRLVLETPSTSRLELVRVHPADILSRRTGAARISREILGIVRTSRTIAGFEAP